MTLALFLIIVATICSIVALFYWLIGALPNKRVVRNEDSPHDLFFNPVRDELRDIKNRLE